MHIAFRVDSSTIIGYGHVMRCLTLAHALLHKLKTAEVTTERSGASQKLLISFICRKHQGHINQLILDAHFNLLQLPEGEQEINANNSNSWLGTTSEQDSQQCIILLQNLPFIDLLIVDHYAIDHQWHTLMNPYYQKLLAIDDLANRNLTCDYLLDQTFNRKKEAYQPLVPEHCQLLLGQDYILLRDEFSLLKNKALRRRKQHINQDAYNLSSTNIIISMGGTDPDNLSQLALVAIEMAIKKRAKITVNMVISSQSNHLSSLTEYCEERPWVKLITDSKNMASLMLSADIAIGACGGTTWERCCLGLPCLTIITAENQQLIANNLSQTGAIINLGWNQDVTKNSMIAALDNLLNNVQFYQAMTDACFTICDGQGAKRVVEQLISVANKIALRPAEKKHCQLIYRWQSNKHVRKYARNPNTPNWEEHQTWYEACLLDPNRLLYLLYDAEQCIVGLLRLDHLLASNQMTNTYEISIIIAPEHQGKGIAKNALTAMKGLHKNASYLATILNENKVSKKVFANVGFKQVAACTYQLNIVNFQNA